MNIQTYAKLHCRDILERAEARKSFDELANFPYDEIIEADDGALVRVVNTQSGNVPIADILGMQRDEFAKYYPTEEQLDAYDKYVAMFTIIEGPEVLNQVRNAIAREQERMDLYEIHLPV